jgi:hypothetical protein
MTLNFPEFALPHLTFISNASIGGEAFKVELRTCGIQHTLALIKSTHNGLYVHAFCACERPT